MSNLQKLRDLYKQTQNNAYSNIDRVTHDRVKKILAFATRQLDTLQRNNDFTSMDEVVFYRDHFKQLDGVFVDSLQQNWKKSKFQTEVRAVMEKDYSGNGPSNSPLKVETPDRLSLVRETSREYEPSGRPKDEVHSYLDTKKTEIITSKLGFKSVLEGMPYAPRPFAVKQNGNSADVKKLQEEIRRLKDELAGRNDQRDFHQGLAESERRQNQQRIQSLTKHIYALQRQNQRLKSQGTYTNSIPVSTSPRQAFQEYTPYTIKYKENDISKINSRNQEYAYSILNMMQYDRSNGQRSELHGNGGIGNFNLLLQDEVIGKTKNSKPLASSYGNNYGTSYKQTSMNNFNVERDRTFQRQNSIQQSHFVHHNQSQPNEILERCKLGFFMQSMVLYRSNSFDVAFKRSPLSENMSFQRVIVYINNREKSTATAQIDWIVDDKYYKVNVDKRLKKVQAKGQGRQEVQVEFRGKSLDSLIEGLIHFNDKTIKIILPAMFIEFTRDPINASKAKTTHISAFTPLTQLETFSAASQLLPVEKDYNSQKVVVKGKWKNGASNIIMDWKRNGLQVDAIEQWSLFLGWVMMKEEDFPY